MADKQLENERQIIETYMQEHGLETTLNDVVNNIVKTRPADPYVKLGQSLLRSSETANSITAVRATEVLNGHGTPALEVEVETQQGKFRAISGLGPFDDDEDRHGGFGLKKAADSVKAVLADKLVNVDVTNMEAIDALLLGEDAPANAVLALSVACCKAAARHGGLEVHEHVAALAASAGGVLPMPTVAVVNGGSYGTSTSCPFEEVSVVPVAARSLEDALEVCASVFRRIPEACAAAGLPKPGLGTRGGYAVEVATPGDAVKVVHEAIKLASAEESVKIAVDVGAPAYAKQHEDEEETTVYDLAHFEGLETPPPPKSADEMVEAYFDLLLNYPVIGLEDPFLSKDIFAFLKLKERLDLEAARAAEPTDVDGENPDDMILRLAPLGGDDACTLQLVGDVVCENTDDIDKYDEQKTINTLCLTLSKGKTVSGAIDLVKAARSKGWGVVVSAETARPESDDAFAAHFAVGVRSGQFKAGGLGGLEHANKYNELLRIAGEANAPPFIAGEYRAANNVWDTARTR
ncbi:phosphopyruvate hydratase [Aureococcus anophagefferens]|nr:phosphopyruvate hydratase [Aureococcus anophagefferens]